MALGRKPIEVKRCIGEITLDSSGEFSAPDVTRITIVASVQPLKANEMQALPEGRRECRAVKIYSDKELLVADQDSGQQSDIFYWQGRWYEVVASDGYRSDIINHFKALATEIKLR